eukprot:5810667-Amphidinium_carterae.2
MAPSYSLRLLLRRISKVGGLPGLPVQRGRYCKDSHQVGLRACDQELPRSPTEQFRTKTNLKRSLDGLELVIWELGSAFEKVYQAMAMLLGVPWGAMLKRLEGRLLENRHGCPFITLHLTCALQSEGEAFCANLVCPFARCLCGCH